MATPFTILDDTQDITLNNEEQRAWEESLSAKNPAELVELYEDYYQNSYQQGTEPIPLPTPQELRDALSLAPDIQPSPPVKRTVPVEISAERVRDHLLEIEEVLTASGLPHGEFHPVRLARAIADPAHPHHGEIKRGFTLAFGLLLEWFATLQPTELSSDDWDRLVRTTFCLCSLLTEEPSEILRSYSYLAEALLPLVVRQEREIPSSWPRLTGLVREAVKLLNSGGESRPIENKVIKSKNSSYSIESRIHP